MRVKFYGIKGRDGDYDLGKAALIVGENETGKSTILAGIHFALSGRVPALRLGKGDSQDAGKLLKMIGDGGWAEVTGTSNRVGRRLEATAKKARVVTYCGDTEGPEAEALAAQWALDLNFADFRLLLAAGDKERAALLAQYLPQPADADQRAWLVGAGLAAVSEALAAPKKRKGTETATAVTAQFAAAEYQAAEEQRLAQLAAANACLPLVSDVVRALRGQVVGETKPPATAADVIENLRERANVAQKAKTEGAAAAKTATSSSGDAGLAAEIPALEAQVNELRAQLADATKQATMEQTRLGRLKQTKEAGRTAVAAYKQALAAGEAQAAKTAEAAKAQAMARELEAQRPAATASTDLPALNARAARLTADLATAQAQAAERRRLLGGQTTEAAMQAAATRTEAARVALTAHAAAKPQSVTAVLPDALPAREQAVALVVAAGQAKRATYTAAQAGTCPILSAPCARLGEAVPQLQRDLEALRTQLAAAKAERDQHQQAAELARQTRAAFDAALAAWNARLVELTQAEHAARTAQATLLTDLARCPDVGPAMARLETDLAAATREAQMAQATQGDYATRLEAWTREHAAATQAALAAQRAQQAAVDEAARLPTLAAQIEALKTTVKELETQAPTVTVAASPEALAAAEKRLAAAHAAQARTEVLAGLDADALDRAARLWKAAYTGAKVGVASCLQAALAPVAGPISQALATMGLPGRFAADLTTMELGLDIDGTYRSVDALCGSELVRYAVALLSAVPARSGPRVLTVEGVELSPTRLARLLAGIDLTKFDAVVIATCHRPTAVPEGWTVIDLDVLAGKAVNA
jgi:hypothetical protein